MSLLKNLLSKEWFRLVGVLLIGITIGVIFYPTKRIEERMTLKHEEEIQVLKDKHAKEVYDSETKWLNQYMELAEQHKESEKKVVKLSEEVKNLQSKQKTAYYKLIKPDGTIEIRKFTESEVSESTKVISSIQEEFKEKINSIEQKWSKIHEERVTKIQKEIESKEFQYKRTIQELEKTKTVSVNEKKFGLEIGYTNERNYYGHASMDLWGPVFIGLHGQLGSTNNNINNMGIGLGLRF